MAATSVLSLHATAGEPRLDANQDGVINFPDLTAALEVHDFLRVNAVLSNWGLQVVLPDGLPTNPPTSPPIPPPLPGNQTAAKKPIARWADVPYRTVEQPYRLRVVAEDITGILAVSFNANQGATVFVTEPVWSAETNGYEYVALIDPADLEPGERVDVAAIVYPNSGAPRALAGALNSQSADSGEFSMVVFGPALKVESRFVSRNGNDAAGDGRRANPYRTIERAVEDLENIGSGDQMFIYLEAGAHPFGGPRVDAPNDRWLTITPAPGVNPGSVRLVAGATTRIGAPRVRLANLTLDQRSAWSITGFSTINDALWLDSVNCLGPGRWEYAGTIQSEPVFATNIAAYFVTESTASDYVNGFRGATMVRGGTLRRLGSDAYSNSRLVLNCSVDDVDNGTTAFHPDIYQFSGTGTRDNTFIRGLAATGAQCQGIFAGGLDLLVNSYIGSVSIHRGIPEGNVPPWSQWAVYEANHFLIDGLQLLDSTWAWRTPHMTNIQVRGLQAWREIVGSHPGSGEPGVREESWFVD